MRVWRVMTAVLAACILLTGTVAAEPIMLFDSEDGELLDALAAAGDEVWPAVSDGTGAPAVGGKGAILIDQGSGTVLFEKNADERLPIASVTKIMTLLLVAEAVDEGLLARSDRLTCSPRAASMGGSQIWLEVGETMTADELIKAAAVVSANDACAVLAEHLCGSIEVFVDKMNARAAALGCENTRFVDCSGLNDTGYSCARDVATMARQLMTHAWITDYTTIWMDTLRGGASQLVNTNRLVRHYEGATGLKTGTTAAAGHCLAATATRGDLSLVAVILGCSTTDERFGGARAMLDHGFALYGSYTPVIDPAALTPIPVRGGKEPDVTPVPDGVGALLIPKGRAAAVHTEVTLPPDLQAPVYEGQTVGAVTVTLDGEILAEFPLRAACEVGEMDWKTAMYRMLTALLC